MSKLQNLHNMMEKLSTQCAEWLADGTKPSEVKDVLRGNLLAYFDTDLADAMVNDIMNEASKQALDILEKRSFEEPVSLIDMYEIING